MIDNVTKEEEKVLIKKVVYDLLNDPRLNAWEKEFLANISSQLPVKDLSEKQLSVLNKIRQKYKKPGWIVWHNILHKHGKPA